MNPIMESLYPSGIQPTQPQQQATQPQQGIASLAPQMTPPPGGIQPIHNQEFIDPGVGQFNPPSSAFPDPSAPTDQFGNTIGWNPPPINLFPSQPPGYQPPGVQPGTGTFDHLTDNPYVQGPPDNFVTIEGVRYNVPPVSQPGAMPPQQTQPPQQTPTPPPQQVYFPGGTPGFDESAPYGQGQQFNPNQGIASLAGTSPGI